MFFFCLTAPWLQPTITSLTIVCAPAHVTEFPHRKENEHGANKTAIGSWLKATRTGFLLISQCHFHFEWNANWMAGIVKIIHHEFGCFFLFCSYSHNLASLFVVFFFLLFLLLLLYMCSLFRICIGNVYLISGSNDIYPRRWRRCARLCGVQQPSCLSLFCCLFRFYCLANN